ncbi:hypothetical protein QCA50_018492 [Cerrena zonata]|uniref:Cytochrome P450 n=1 Tax=Cerrena zonata TaxID=2478898 RepID=A0AAW0FMG0_9APHY
MGLYPEIQRKAQEELDRIVGPNRLPEFSDYDDLIYVQAIALESMRWMMVLPLGVPHRVTRDDEYKGFFIPAGSTIIVNAWSILHDPDVFPEPENFKPERFIKDGRLDPSVRNPLEYAFGFGRRVCPGRHLSSASLFMTIASVLHTLKINPAEDEDGNLFDGSTMLAAGLAAGPNRVPCSASPRSADAEHLIRVWCSMDQEEQ